MLRQQLSKGNNGLTKTKFLTYGIIFINRIVIENKHCTTT